MPTNSPSILNSVLAWPAIAACSVLLLLRLGGGI